MDSGFCQTGDSFQPQEPRDGDEASRIDSRAGFTSRIIQGDVIRALDKLPRGMRFDVAIIDPPYNIGKNFGNNTDSMPLGEYLKWSQKWASRCRDLLTDNGIAYIYGFPETLARISAMYPVEEQRWLVWHYANKAAPSSRFWQRSHESILCLWKPGQRRPALEIDQIREPYTEGFLKGSAGKARKGTKSRFSGGKGTETVYRAHRLGALPRDVLKIPALAGGAGAAERWFVCHTCGNRLFPPGEFKSHRGHSVLRHPTQKPMELTRRLIRSRITGRNGKILVPFAGSGSECVVAARMGIGFLGIEINPDYARLARKWVKAGQGGADSAG